MNQILSYAICLFIIILAITSSVKKSLKKKSISFSLERVFYYFSMLISLLLITLKIDVILNEITKISTVIFNLNGIYNDVCKIGLLVALFFILQVVVYKIFSKLLLPIFSILNKENKIILTFFSFVFGVIKGLIFLSMICICLIIYNNTLGIYNKIDLFEENKIYSSLSSILDRNTSELTDEMVQDFLPTSNIIVYYNGVTIEDGIKSNDKIDKMAKELTKNSYTEIDKAKILYLWIGSNIKYDYDRAEKALNNEKIENSGAISAFENRSGICFDYSCLYVAMAKATGLKVRLITGTAYDGVKYGPHAWNEVYIDELEKWIPLDTTFYLSGDYFNNNDFYEDHIIDSIAGEW